MNRFDKVTVLGGGAFGVALAKLAAERAGHVMLWARNAEVCHYINLHHHHPNKLTNILMPSNITAVSDLALALKDSKVVILALPMKALREVLGLCQNLLATDAIIICTAKGIEEESLLLSSDIIAELLPKLSLKSCYLSGPSFAIELALGLPTALTLASRDKDSALYFQEGFSRKNCRLYRSDDVVGVCVAGALKNVIAIASGACVGLNLGRNALAALLTRGLAEISRLAVSMGGKSSTISGLSGVGDMILSCTDDMSRNHRLGAMIADGMKLEQALAKIGGVVEGAQSAKSIPLLMDKYGIDLPISLATYQVLYEQVSAKSAISALLSRKLKNEF